MNYPQVEVGDIIQDCLAGLVNKLAKEGVQVDVEDFQYSFFQRCEHLTIPTNRIYRDEAAQDILPQNIGVGRGYAGGGLHSGLQATPCDRLPAHRQAKLARITKLFAETFWQVFEMADKATEEETGETLELWEKTAI